METIHVQVEAIQADGHIGGDHKGGGHIYIWGHTGGGHTGGGHTGGGHIGAAI